ncbi:short chain dehydrogenase (plasmid) [Streptomyces griseofuscus]|uniref:Short chain dehydrogenase n=1 Tax=Streptomyces griseofuscus TaxID=146922 RepID=A0A7H1QCU4_9ACTN|nr:SDR family NAD(P)-dependent oxidoreductase [Streptomyces griseofuscus]QNT98124.1 short chain dehydrogenase [Streptomyces griseofuscus]
MLLSEDDVALFARVSGDHNALHCRPDYARGTPFGRTVAHGVLAALGTLEEQAPEGAGAGGIEVDFGNPVFPGVRYRSEALGGVRAGAGRRLLDGDRACLTVRVRPGTPPDVEPLPAPPVRTAPRHTIGELPPGTTVSGTYGPDGLDALCDRFPVASRLLGRLPLACLLWSSHLAGMRLPGENCLLGRVALDFRPVAVSGPARLSYTARVVHADPRFGLLTIAGEVSADGVVVAVAEIEAMVREPAPLATAAALGAHLSPSTRLRGTSAVVVGGSRGLGAALSLALVSQGCEVFVGHRSTLPQSLLDDAGRLPGLLRSAPGDAADPRWSDGLRARAEQKCGGLDFLVCSAAPPLRTLGLAATDLDRMDAFLTGSLRLVSAPLAGLLPLLRPGRSSCLVVSSAALREPPRDWPHYVAAKSAVEGLVHWAARHHPGVGFLLARPGMLWTEQTNSPSARETAGPVEPVAARLVRRLLDPPPTSPVPELIALPAEPVAAGPGVL